jgi:hypothetical protein
MGITRMSGPIMTHGKLFFLQAWTTLLEGHYL